MARRLVRFLTSKDVGEQVRLTPAGVRRLVRTKELVPDAATMGGVALFNPQTVARLVRYRATAGAGVRK